MNEFLTEIYEKLDKISKIEDERKKLKEQYDVLLNSGKELNERLCEVTDNISENYVNMSQPQDKLDKLEKIKAKLEGYKREKLKKALNVFIPYVFYFLILFAILAETPLSQALSFVIPYAVVSTSVALVMYRFNISKTRKLVKNNKIEDVNKQIEENEKQLDELNKLSVTLNEQRNEIYANCMENNDNINNLIDLDNTLETNKDAIIKEILAILQSNRSNDNIFIDENLYLKEDINKLEDTIPDLGPCKKMSQ
jgi:chromosome segregation ATPase